MKAITVYVDVRRTGGFYEASLRGHANITATCVNTDKGTAIQHATLAAIAAVRLLHVSAIVSPGIDES